MAEGRPTPPVHERWGIESKTKQTDKKQAATMSPPCHLNEREGTGALVVSNGRASLFLADIKEGTRPGLALVHTFPFMCASALPPMASHRLQVVFWYPFAGVGVSASA